MQVEDVDNDHDFMTIRSISIIFITLAISLRCRAAKVPGIVLYSLTMRVLDNVYCWRVHWEGRPPF